jgi:methionine synthase I (cobalamin-dependent)
VFYNHNETSHMTFPDSLGAPPWITDGAWGTELQKRGLPPGGCPDAWNLTNPDAVSAVAQAYVGAGSQIILTTTVRANGVSLAGAGLAARAREINAAGVRLSRQAAGGHALVFASMGPTGKMLVTGEIDEDSLLAAFRAQAEALATEGPDALLLETFSDLEEASIALRAALTTGLPVVVSFAFDSGKNKDRTMMGVAPEPAATRMAELGAAAIGSNCGVGIEAAAAVCRRLHAASNLPVWMKPNAGLPEVGPGGEVVYRATAEGFAGHAAELRDAGASFIGGCCGSTPDFIRALAAARTGWDRDH